MANLNPLVPGDVPYPQYSVTTTEEISVGLAIVKGEVYTKNATGELIQNIGTLETGIFQARETPFVNVPALAGDTVQVLGPRTRMLLIDIDGGLVVGNLVNAIPGTADVLLTLDTLADEFIGRVFEIYTKNSVTGSKKKVAAAGDLVIVETVGP